MELLYSFTTISCLIEQASFPSSQDILDTTPNHSNTSLLPCTQNVSQQFVAVSDCPQRNAPLWNLSSNGGTIFRTLLKSAFEEVDTCTGSMMAYSVQQRFSTRER